MADVLCYNRGCGKSFNPRSNPSESTECVYHPGAPFFHETYKGWSCCGKKSTDFTDFLNTPGCTKGPHSNVKPHEPESITGKKDDRSLEEQMSAIKKERTPEVTKLHRPDFDTTPLVLVTATRAPSLNVPKTNCAAANGDTTKSDSTTNAISDGESCKNSGCKTSYGSATSSSQCVHHPGVAIFHEGMKFWSCCQRKTSDFQSFLNQEGCVTGEHKWKKDNEGSAKVTCRLDWHQTASHVSVAVYAKNYDPNVSKIEISPVRLKVHLYFPQQGGAFDTDLELKGVVCVEESSAIMAGTKVEIKLKKAEPGSWTKLDIPRVVVSQPKAAIKETTTKNVDSLDLDDVELGPSRSVLSSEASGGRTGENII